MKKSNKGFSLVELIIVIAIMAVLIAVLAPQYLQYVEKTKKQADASAVAEVVKAGEVAVADPLNKVTSGSCYVEVDTNGNITSDNSSVQTEVKDVCGSKINLKSKAFTKTASRVTFTIDSNGHWTKGYTGPIKDYYE